jgi:hypothetical protein
MRPPGSEGPRHSGSRRRATCEKALGRSAGHRPAHATHVHTHIRREPPRHNAVQERARIPVPSSRWSNSRPSTDSPVQGRAAHKPVRQRKLQIRFLLRLPGMHPDQGFPPLMQSPTSTSSCCPYFLRSSRLSALSRPGFAAIGKLCSCRLPACRLCLIQQRLWMKVAVPGENI